VTSPISWLLVHAGSSILYSWLWKMSQHNSISKHFCADKESVNCSLGCRIGLCNAFSLQTMRIRISQCERKWYFFSIYYVQLKTSHHTAIKWISKGGVLLQIMIFEKLYYFHNIHRNITENCRLEQEYKTLAWTLNAKGLLTVYSCLCPDSGEYYCKIHKFYQS
jgi:hypothetical protein